MTIVHHREDCKCEECKELKLIELASKLMLLEDKKLFEELAKK